MKAVVYDRYGPPDVMRIEELPIPEPGADHALVKIAAAGVNAADWRLLRGQPFLVRATAGGLRKPKLRILGADLAGRVESLGTGVTNIAVGDAVYGHTSECGFGAFAEYASVPASALVPKPATSSFVEAAAIPGTGLAALQGLRDHGRIRSGHRVLINGAAGGVGTFAVQIAKAFGAHVTGVCSTRNVSLVRSIGADEVVDYTRADFTMQERVYDLILDAAAYRPLRDVRAAVHPDGTYVMVGGSPPRSLALLLAGPLISAVMRRRMRFLITKPNQQDLLALTTLVESGQLRPVIDRTYPLADVPRALGYLEAGHARGKVIVVV